MRISITVEESLTPYSEEDYVNGRIEGNCHQADGPVRDIDGFIDWYQYGKSHHVNGPAAKWDKKYQIWSLIDLMHRLDGPAYEAAGGFHKEWRVEGKRHRTDGPAVVKKIEEKQWWVNNQLHREDGPAVIHVDGRKEYWLNGVRKS